MKRILSSVSLAVIAIIIASCSSGKSDIYWVYDSQLNAKQLEAAKQIVALFEKKCAAIIEYPASVASASVKFYSPGAQYREETYGWKNELELTIEVKQDATLPSSFIDAIGHTLQFYIGSGNQTGILTQKTEGQKYYGMQVVESGDGFQSDNEYQIVKELQQ